MAKRQKKTQTASGERRDLTMFCAFWAMTIAAMMYILSGVINLFIKLISDISTKTAGALSTITSVANFLANLALVIAIALPAYGFVRGRSRSWKVFYWIALAIYALGVVFGMISGLI
jgi:lysylphosphatidylglycerol synthetase-like protein (DUF2156 family)